MRKCKLPSFGLDLLLWVPFHHEKPKQRGTETLSNTYIMHKLADISVGVAGATYWSYCKTELYAVLLVMKMNMKWNLCCSHDSYVFHQAG